MNKPITYYQIILDESGSMSDCQNATLQGLMEQQNKVKELSLKYPDQEVRMGICTFNNAVKFVLKDHKVDELFCSEELNYRPAGGTALFDAIGFTINELLELPMKEEDSFVVIIITDGYENASHVFSHSKIQLLIEELEKSGKWTFTYLGATIDSVDIATDLNIKQANTMRFSKKNMNSDIWDNLGDSMDNYLSNKDKGDKFTHFLKKNNEGNSN